MYEIRSEIPIPGIRQINNEWNNQEYKKAKEKLQDLINQLKIGESIAFPKEEKDIVTGIIQRLRQEKKFVTRMSVDRNRIRRVD